MKLLKLEGGRVRALNTKGTGYINIGELNAQNAQLIDDQKIAVTYWNGKTKLYNRNGHLIHNN